MQAADICRTLRELADIIGDLTPPAHAGGFMLSLAYASWLPSA